MAVVRSGAEVEPEMGELYRALHEGRRANLLMVAKSIRSQGGSQRGPSAERMADILWQLASPEMFGLMNGVGGYSTRRFSDWLAAMLKSTLLRQ